MPEEVDVKLLLFAFTYYRLLNPGHQMKNKAL